MDASAVRQRSSVSSVQKLLRLVAVFLPQRLKHALFRQVLGWDIADDAYIGMSYMGADSVRLGPGSHIGHFNIVRNISTLDIGSRTYIKDFNHIFGCTPVGTVGERAVRIGNGCHIMSRHFLDVGGAITMEDRTLLAGRGTQIYTHSLVAPTGVDEWRVGEMVICEGAQVFAGALLVHCRIPPGAIVAAGAVLAKSYEDEPGQRLVIAGNPAVVVGHRALPAQDPVPHAPG